MIFQSEWRSSNSEWMDVSVKGRWKTFVSSTVLNRSSHKFGARIVFCSLSYLLYLAHRIISLICIVQVVCQIYKIIIKRGFSISMMTGIGKELQSVHQFWQIFVNVILTLLPPIFPQLKVRECERWISENIFHTFFFNGKLKVVVSSKSK